MKNTAIVVGQPSPLARLRARNHFAVALLLCAAFTQKINDKFGKS